MNIFLVDKDPQICALALDDLRLNKMIIETGQMLSTAFRYHFKSDINKYSSLLYKETHINHPCNVWLRRSLANYEWTLRYFQALYEERRYRTLKSHATWDRLFWLLQHYENSRIIKPRVAPQFDNADCFNCSNHNAQDIFMSYKLCMVDKWQQDIMKLRKPKWTRRGPPDWINSYIKEHI